MTTRVAADPANPSKYSQFKTTNYGVPRGGLADCPTRVRLNRFEESSFAPAIRGIHPNFMVPELFSSLLEGCEIWFNAAAGWSVIKRKNVFASQLESRRMPTSVICLVFKIPAQLGRQGCPAGHMSTVVTGGGITLGIPPMIVSLNFINLTASLSSLQSYVRWLR